MVRNLIFAIFACFMIGCVSTQHLSNKNKSSINKVYFEPGQKKAIEMYYFGPGNAVGMMFGAVGGLVTGIADIKPGRALDKFAVDNGIYIENIATESLKQNLIKSNKFEVVNSLQEADAKIRVTILNYGFSVPYTFSSKVVPILHIMAEMYSESDAKLWQAAGSTNTLPNPAKKRKISEFKNDPTLIAESWKTG